MDLYSSWYEPGLSWLDLWRTSLKCSSIGCRVSPWGTYRGSCPRISPYHPRTMKTSSSWSYGARECVLRVSDPSEDRAHRAWGRWGRSERGWSSLSSNSRRRYGSSGSAPTRGLQWRSHSLVLGRSTSHRPSPAIRSTAPSPPGGQSARLTSSRIRLCSIHHCRRGLGLLHLCRRRHHPSWRLNT